MATQPGQRMSYSEVIYDCNNFEVIWREGAPGLLLVTFSSLGMFNSTGSVADGHSFWGRTLAEKLGYSAAGFVAKRRDWFCSPEMPEACRVVRKHAARFGPVVTYGSSMGGYAALRWAKELGATSTVAFAPQFSINPDIVASFDTRYTWAFSGTINEAMEITNEHIGPASFILFDSMDPRDKKHSALIHAAAPGVNLVPIAFCGHECVRVFANAKLADSLIRLCAAADVPGVLGLVRRARKAAAIRIVEVAMRLAPRKPCLAESLFQAHSAVFERAQKAQLSEKVRRARDCES